MSIWSVVCLWAWQIWGYETVGITWSMTKSQSTIVEVPQWVQPPNIKVKPINLLSTNA